MFGSTKAELLHKIKELSETVNTLNDQVDYIVKKSAKYKVNDIVNYNITDIFSHPSIKTGQIIKIQNLNGNPVYTIGSHYSYVGEENIISLCECASPKKKK